MGPAERWRNDGQAEEQIPWRPHLRLTKRQQYVVSSRDDTVWGACDSGFWIRDSGREKRQACSYLPCRSFQDRSRSIPSIRVTS